MFRLNSLLITTAMMAACVVPALRADHRETAATFKTKCAMCHAAEGSGDNAYGKKNNLRDLRSPEVQKQTDDELKAVIGKGKGKMPGYAKQLSAAQTDSMVAFIRELAKKK